ncbi:MAG: GerAB/ArcD/ProY family transporter [Bacillota bacterium]
MQEKGIISTNQFIWMLFIIITSVTVMQAPLLLINIAGRDAWLSVIGGWVLDVLLALVYAYMGIRFPGQNFVQYSITILGKYLGRIIGIMFPLFFLLVSILLQSALVQLINTVLLQQTPMVVLLSITFILSAYAVRGGIETVARASQFVGPIYILFIIFIGLSSISEVNIDFFKPQLEHGFYPFMIGSPFMLSFYGICIMMAMFIPICNRPEDGFLAKFTAVSMGAFFVGIVVVVAISIFGLEYAQRAYAPVYQITSLIPVRAEAVWLIVIISAGIMSTAMMIWAFSLGVSQIFGLRTYKPLVIPISLISVMICWVSFRNNIKLMNFVNYTFPVIAVLVEGILEIFLFVVALALKKRG